MQFVHVGCRVAQFLSQFNNNHTNYVKEARDHLWSHFFDTRRELVTVKSGHSVYVITQMFSQIQQKNSGIRSQVEADVFRRYIVRDQGVIDF